MKRAQGLPVNTIIIAALALIVLIVLIGIFGARTQKFGKGVTEATKPETCSNVKTITECDEPLPGNYVKPSGEKLAYNEVCCAS